MSGVDTARVVTPIRVGTERDAAQQARIDLAALHRIAVLENLHEGTWNQFSCKVPGRPGHIFLSPGQTHFSRVTASSLVELDPAGKVVGGEGRLNVSAWAIHDPIQRARPDITCVLHVHAPHSTALSSIDGWRFNERGSQNASIFYGTVAYCSYEGIITEEDEGERMVEALGDKRVLFLANHGVLVVGETLEKAMLFLYQLERACMNEALVYSMGRSLNSIPEDAARYNAELSKDSAGEAGYLNGMKAVLDDHGQDYAS